MVDLATIIARERPRSRGPYYDPVSTPFRQIIVGDAYRLTPLFMKSFGITHVINCADHAVCPLKLPENRYVCIGAQDTENVHLFKTWYAKFKEAMDRFLEDPECTNIYVHCQAGINRSAFLAAGYIHDRFKVPIDRCVERMVRQRPCVMTNAQFLKQLEEFSV